MSKSIYEISTVCYECGVSANVLTCLKKYGNVPMKLSYSVSTYSDGTCEYCGEEKKVTDVRDFFYPEFELLPQVIRMFDMRKSLLRCKK